MIRSVPLYYDGKIKKEKADREISLSAFLPFIVDSAIGGSLKE